MAIPTKFLLPRFFGLYSSAKKARFSHSGKSGTIHFSNFPYRHKKLQTSAFTALGLQILSFIRHGNYLNRQDSPTFTTGTATSSDVLSP